MHFSVATRVLILRPHYRPSFYNTIYLTTVPHESYSSLGGMSQLTRIVSQKKIPIESFFRVLLWVNDQIDAKLRNKIRLLLLLL